MRKVKEDKKRMKEMIAQDLPGKPRYPIFSSIVGVCCVIDIDDHEEMEGNKDTAVAATKAGGSGNITTDHTYTGQGANMDGLACFVDLEANTPKSGSSNQREAMEEERNGRNVCEEEDRQVWEHDQQALPAASNTAVEDGTAPNIAVQPDQSSELSDVSSVSEESTEASVSQSESDNVVLSKEQPHNNEHSNGLVDSWESEPSDDDDVVYTISSSNSGDECNGK